MKHIAIGIGALFGPGDVAVAQSTLRDDPVIVSRDDDAEKLGGPEEGDEEYVIYGPDGKPLPPEVQAQLRAYFKENPPQISGEPGDITVTNNKPRGAILLEALPSRSFAPIDINAYGANNVGELVEFLSPQLYNPGDRQNTPAHLLLNGRRVANPLDIAAIPTEAIERLDVFSEQVAVQYGFSANANVINIVTFENFSSVFTSAEFSIPTEGGTSSGTANADVFRIQGDARLGLGVTYFEIGQLTENERGVIQPFGNEDLSRLRALIPAAQNIALNGNIARPIGTRVGASLTARYRNANTDALVGALDELALKRSFMSEEFELGLNLDGQLKNSALMASLLYSEESDSSRISQLTTDRTLDFSSFDRRDLTAELSFVGAFAQVSGGTLSGSVIADAGRSEIDAFALQANSDLNSTRIRSTAGLSLSLNAPILPTESAVGQVITSFDLQFRSLSDVADLRRTSARLEWMPSRPIRVAFAYIRAAKAPTLEQLGRPNFTSPNVRTLDFITGDTVDVDVLTGGNSELVNEVRNEFEARFSYRPFRLKNLLIDAVFSSLKSRNPIAEFPLLTRATTDAFPGRFTRSADNQLTSIDIRALNFSRAEQDRIFWGLSYSRPLGEGQGSEEPLGQSYTSVEDARRAFPNAIVTTVAPTSNIARQVESLTSRLFFSIYHTWVIKDKVRLSPNVNFLNLLEGDAADYLGGRREHRIRLDAGIYKGGIGVRVDVDWNSATLLQDSASGEFQKLHFDDYAISSLQIFADLQGVLSEKGRDEWLKGIRATFKIDNIFNQRPLVQTNEGLTPIRYQGPFLDPLGRVISISLRKTF